MTGFARASFDANAGAASAYVSSHALADTSQTLASKQNRWMTGHSIMPQPPIVPSNDGQMPARHASFDRQAPSNSTSPHLANTIAPPKDPRPQSSDLLPSPAPSDDFTMEPPAARLCRTPDDVSAASRAATPITTTTTSMDGIRKRAAERGFDAPDKRHASGDVSATRPLASPGLVQIPQQSDQNFRRPYLQFSHPTAQQHQAQAQNHIRSRSNSEIQLQQFQQRAGSQPGTPAVPPPALDSEYFTLAECKMVLQRLHEQAANQLKPLDYQRIGVLEDAIKNGDVGYLSAHQYYCMATLRQPNLPLSLRNLPELPAAMGYLSEVLGVNQDLSPPLLLWFANFPKASATIASDWPLRYNQEQKAFLRFASLFGTRYHSFKNVCRTRRWPPLARELYDILGIVSQTLGKLVWRCIRRSIWTDMLPPRNQPHPETQFEAQAESLFDTNQQAFLGTYNWQRWNPTSTIGDDQEDSQYGVQLKNILTGYEQAVMAHVMQEQQQTNTAPLQSPVTQGITFSGPPQRVNPNTSLRSQPIVAQDPSAQVDASARPATHYVPQPHRGRPPMDDATHNVQLRSGPDIPQAHRAPDITRPRRGRPPVDDATHNAQLRGGLGRPPGCPPVCPSNHDSGNVRHPSQYAPSRNSHQSHRPQLSLLLPAVGFQPPQPIDPIPARSGLHQAHLRSPILANNPTKDTRSSLSNPLYQYVKSFVVPPRILSCDPLSPDPPLQLWRFWIDKTAFDSIPRDVIRDACKPGTRIIDESTQTCRLRSVKWTSKEPVTEPTWFTADSTWIPTTYFKLNGHALEPRKKLHHGKDLPIDLTHLIREGENVLEIAIVRCHAQKNKLAGLDYALAIEIIGVKMHEDIKMRCAMNRKPKDEVLNAIKTSLAASDADDELSITSSNLSITLFDPMSACKIFDIPVRGRHCLHHDCFDLETFLSTRKRKQPTWPTIVDHWRCPICKADVRPPNLIVDGFLEEIREILASQGRLDTRAIVVNADGTWAPKPEKRDENGVRDPDTPDEEARPQQPPTAQTTSTAAVIAPDKNSAAQLDRVVITLDD